MAARGEIRRLAHLSLATIMLEQLAAARRVVEDGDEMVPAWRINTAEGTFLIFTRFDTHKDEQRERTPFQISRFMVWKMATSFVLTAQTWLGTEKTRSADEALLAVGVSRHERLAVLQRIRRGDAVNFSEPMWWALHDVDDQHSAMLPTGAAVCPGGSRACARLRQKRRTASWAVELRPAVAPRKKGTVS
jgi:hypothetical protein